jgi:transglutaminase-like putative cysteine protease
VVLYVVLALVVIAAAIALPIVRARAGRPLVMSIEPSIGEPGSLLLITGKHFGSERGEGRVEFDRAAPTTSSYLSWSDEKIELRIPLYAESNLVHVVTERGRSNAKMFMSRALLPSAPVGSSLRTLGPSIESLSSDSGVIGALVTIKGLNFGANRGDSSVLFTWMGESGIQVQNDESGRGYVSPQDSSGEYESWSDKEIRVRIPDGAITGGIAVKTTKGSSPVRYFQVLNAPGTKIYGGRRTYALSSFVTISRVQQTGPNSLYVWMPFPAETPSQRGVKALGRSTEPLLPDYHGLSAYRLVDLVADKLTTVEQDHLVQVYGVQTDVKVDKIQAPPAPAPRLYTTMVQADTLVPSDDPAIVALAKKAAGREKNHYKIAQASLVTLASSVSYDAGSVSDSAAKALSGGKVDAWDMAIIYAAMLRASGIPALPVAGVLVDDSRRAWRHVWAEFYIYGFGWIPVDPVLATGGDIGQFKPAFDDRSRYFGNLDDRHIAFSRGLTIVDRISPDGRTVAASRRYSFQNIFEEATGAIAAYTSFWSDVEITGVY